MPAIYTVSQLSSHTRQTLERDTVLQDFWVNGEVANLARPGSGHSYFSIRDGNSTMRCVMFRNSRGANYLENGAAIILHGRVSIYEQRGDLQIIADIAQPEGVGELQLRLEQLKLELEQQGLFDESRKRGLPRFPKKVAVVTSPSGSVWHDIQNVVRRRYPLVELAIAPAPVQGEDAAPAIAEALQAAGNESGVDIVILARGGGSLEDLWAFNEEEVARAIFACPVPVVSAVGHETDHTIADLVADLRAPTPSAAAELVVPDSAELIAFAIASAQSMDASISRQVTSGIEAAQQLGRRLNNSLPDLDTLRLRIDDRLRIARQMLAHMLSLNGERVDGLMLRLEALSPRDTLRRGYAIVQRNDDGSVVSRHTQAEVGDALDITLTNGAIQAQVTSTEQV
ncbi:MAG: exodeoxyribonuclease VII large subunit [Chloroflexi bacterium]|nr:exodeoxyribonuclease VII large subunit [Chloroflexota bacterium]